LLITSIFPEPNGNQSVYISNDPESKRNYFPSTPIQDPPKRHYDIEKSRENQCEFQKENLNVRQRIGPGYQDKQEAYRGQQYRLNSHKKFLGCLDCSKTPGLVALCHSFLNLTRMNLDKLKKDRYLKYLYLPNFFAPKRTKQILSVNPTIIPHREEAKEVCISVFDYDAEILEEKKYIRVSELLNYKSNGRTTWINVDGLRKADIETICSHFDVHALVVEDILSINQRPKIDESDNIIFCLLNMLYYNEETFSVEQEQISIILGRGVVISFQEDARRDVFNLLREKLRSPNSKIRQRGADYLCYSLLDLIVDHYYLVMEKLGERVEVVEEEVTRGNNSRALEHITHLRKELIVMKRNFSPVRELINGFLRTDSEFVEGRHSKYFKDVYDHIVQAIDLIENYRDICVSMQDLHINNVNLRMNEVMKVMAIVTCLLAPATVIGGVFGMNFQTIPWLHNRFGFFGAVGLMLVIPVWMLWVFRRRGWF
jgi:magnesium transporter